MVIRSNQHLVLANRRSGQEPLYGHTFPLGMLKLQATKGSASFRVQGPWITDPIPQRSQLASHSRFPSFPPTVGLSGRKAEKSASRQRKRPELESQVREKSV